MVVEAAMNTGSVVGFECAIVDDTLKIIVF